MTFCVQGSLLGDLFNGRINIGADSFRLVLLGTGYTWSYAHNRRDDLGANEITAGGGYTTGGVAVSLSTSVDLSAQASILSISSASISPGPVTGARWGAVVKWRGGAASDDELIGVYDWGQVLAAGPLVIPAATITHFR